MTDKWYDNLEKIKPKLHPYRKMIHTLPDVVGTGITHTDVSGKGNGYHGYHLEVYLEKENSAIRRRINLDTAKLQEENIPVDIIVTGKIVLLGFPGMYRPIRPGCGIANALCQCGGTGTLGGFPVDNNGASVILTNKHVIVATNGCHINDPVIQPNIPWASCPPSGYLTNLVGRVKDWIPRYAPPTENRVDCAYATLQSETTIDTNTLCDYKIGPKTTQRINKSIKKTGYSSGCTTGNIKAIDLKISVGDIFVNITRTSPNFTIPGDSGSVIVSNESADMNRAIGLLFAGDADGTGYFCSINDVEETLKVSFGTSYIWDGWDQTSGQSYTIPAIIKYDTRLYVGVRGTDGRLFVKKMEDDLTWGNWNIIGGYLLSGTGPAMTTRGSSRLNIVYTGTDNNLYMSYYDYGSYITTYLFDTKKSIATPGIVFDNLLYYAITGTDHHIYMLAEGGGGWMDLGGYATTGPAMAVFNGKIYIACIGLNNDIFMKEYIRPPSSPAYFTNWYQTPGKSLSIPSMAVFKNKLYMTVAGTDLGIYVKSFDSTNWSGWTTISAPLFSDTGASIYSFNNRLYAMTSDVGSNLLINKYG